MQPAIDAAGEPVVVTIDTRLGLHCGARLEAGRRPRTLLLLDSDVEGNRPRTGS